MKSQMISMKERSSSSPLLLPPSSSEKPQTVLGPKKAAMTVRSVTREEINRYWRMKKIEEEGHLLAALKAAARIRARALPEEEVHRRFEESLTVDARKRGDDGKSEENNKELRVGIKDWWTKSKYAYLNQPAAKPKGDEATSSTFVPQKICGSYSSASSRFQPTSFGIF